MKGEKIFAALNDIREEFITEAAPKKRLYPAVKWCGLAAGLVIVAGTALMLPQDGPKSDPSLPKLTVEEIAGAMGYEGYMAYDITELTNANPWTEDAQLDILPVYKNLQQQSFNGKVAPFPAEEMEKRLISMAEALGLENYIITDNSPDENVREKITRKFASVEQEVPEGYFDPTALLIELDGIEIEADNTLTATVSFDPARELPNGILPSDASYEMCLDAAATLLDEYAALIGMEEPVIDISGGDRNIYTEQSYDICFYEGSGGLTEQIIGYNFNRIVFHRNDEGKLFIIRKSEKDLSGKVGDYPIISADEAEKLLCDGKYITTVLEEMPGEKYIARVELIYRTDATLEFFMPYYRFLVELPEMEREGMKDYGAYYVPAVEEAYIVNMPRWDGSFGS